MLKPRKKIKKNEVEKEPLVERVEATEKFIKENSKLLAGVLAGLLIVVFVVVLMFRSKAKANKQASGELGIAELSLAQGDTADAVLRLEDLISQYSGTTSANFAYALLGKISMAKGNYTEAIEDFKQYLEDSRKQDFFTVQVLNALANCYYIQEDYQGAADTYMEAAKLAPYKFQENKSLLNAAKCYLSLSDVEQARELITRVKDSKPDEQEIKEKLNSLEHQLAAKNI